MKKLFKYVIFVLLTFFILMFSFFAYSQDNENSIFNLDIKFVNQEGKDVYLQDLDGTVKVISMIYTRCKTTCPIIVENMKRIERLLTKFGDINVHYILVSLDPTKDTPDDLKNYGIKNELNFTKWSLLTGPVDSVLQLAVSLGIKYKKEVDGNYIHTNLILLLDKDGNIRYNHPGLNGLEGHIDKLVKKIYKISV